MTRRLAALGALLFATASLALALAAAISSFPKGLSVLACLGGAVAAGMYGVTRRGFARVGGLGAAALLVAGAVTLIVVEHRVLDDVLILTCILLTLACARTAFAVRVALPAAARPRRAVLFLNPHSGGGKGQRFHLADEARARRIEPVELGAEDDLRKLVEMAIGRGADALAMAGGDGSQAIVAAAAAGRGLQYACIPGG